MAFTAAQVFQSANPLLNDDLGTRWPFAERLDWINHGTAEILTLKPSAFAESRVSALSVGARQEIPADAASLIRVVRNIISVSEGVRVAGRAITTTSRIDMDAAMPDWQDPNIHGLVQQVQHAVVDPMAEPRAWYTYPPNSGAGLAEIIIAKRPELLATPGSPTLLASYAASIVPLDDEYRPAMLDYLLYRCFLKEAEFAGSVQRAQAHYAAFANALGVKLANEVKFTPARTLAERQP